MYTYTWGFPGGSTVKNLPVNTENASSIPNPGRSPGGGNGNPLQSSCLGNPMNRGDWQATVDTVAESQTWLKSNQSNPQTSLFSFYIPMYFLSPISF